MFQGCQIQSGSPMSALVQNQLEPLGVGVGFERLRIVMCPFQKSFKRRNMVPRFTWKQCAQSGNPDLLAIIQQALVFH